MRKKHLFIILTLLSAFSIYSQNNNLRSPFLSIHTGAFLTSINDFDKSYGSNLGFVYGFGAALPFSTRSYLFGKATIFSKTGVPVINTYNFATGTWVISKSNEGTTKFTQLIINGGFLYNFFLSPDLTLGVNSGITFLNASEEQKDKNGNYKSSMKISGLFGFFIGTDIEKNFEKSPFSLFMEVQYNLILNDIIQYLGNYNGFNMNLGVRYYFKERRVE